MKIVNISAGEEGKYAALLFQRKSTAALGAAKVAEEILSDIRANKCAAIRKYSLTFDNAEPCELSKTEIDKLANECPRELCQIMEEAAQNIWDYQSRILPKTQIWTDAHGRTLGQLVRPLERAGVYAPGGSAAYPSSVLMCAVPAKVAGVGEIIVATPPKATPNPAVYAAAKIAEVDRVMLIGGIQAIGLLAFGADELDVKPSDIIAGPGNAYVAAAKRLVFGEVNIDMVAGPSEILVIADETANAEWVAADMLSQAEHDVLASAVLITDSATLANATAIELERQLQGLPRREIAEKSLSNYGAIWVCENLDSCVKLANLIAPEHLENLTTVPPERFIAGAIFQAAFSPEPLGDYFAGASHVLPTSGTARFFSPLSAESFVKRTSLIQGVASDFAKIATFARAEGLEAHARSAELRIRN